MTRCSLACPTNMTTDHDDEYGLDGLEDFDDEFGFNDDDELELQALADNADQNGLKHARDEAGVQDEPLSKIPKTTGASSNQVALGVATNVLNNRFKLPGFRLKQELAISRIMSGGSSVVVFPTGEAPYRYAHTLYDSH